MEEIMHTGWMGELKAIRTMDDNYNNNCKVVIIILISWE